MVLKRVVPALVAAALLAGGSVARADEEYRPSEFLGLDLSQAVLSPKRLGPPAEFAPVALQAETEAKEAKNEAAGDHASEPYWAREELDVQPKEVAVQDLRVTPPNRIAHDRIAHDRSDSDDTRRDHDAVPAICGRLQGTESARVGIHL